MSYPGRNDSCPCGSGKKYKRCCANKAFTFVKESEDTVTQVLPIEGGLREIIDNHRSSFLKHFEREPDDDDPLLLGKYLMSEDDIERETIDAMRRTNADPAHIYAYRRTGYLICDAYLDRFTGAAIQEWNAAVKEFHEAGVDPDHGTEATKFDKGLASLAGEFETFTYLFGLANDKFFNTDLLAAGAATATVLTDRQYQALCVSRVHRTLRSIRVLQEGHMSEDILKLARSMYESYLHISFVQTYPESVASLVDAVVGLRTGTHHYKRRKDAAEDKRYIVDAKTGVEHRAHVSAYKMAEASSLPEDVAFFDFFYRTTSEFLHPSVFALDGYLSAHGLDPVKPHMYEEAVIFAACVAAMIADRIPQIVGCPERVARDCRTVVSRVRSTLLLLLEMLDVWQRRLGANLEEVALLRSRCLRLSAR